MGETLFFVYILMFILQLTPLSKTPLGSKLSLPAMFAVKMGQNVLKMGQMPIRVQGCGLCRFFFSGQQWLLTFFLAS